jgi:hypothetical protein
MGSANLVINRQARARWQGLMKCSSVWCCPLCAGKVWAGRAAQLTAGLWNWNEQGGHVALVTLTMRHERSDTLSDLWDALGDSWKAVQQSRGVRAASADLGLVGFVRRIESTHGANGWHLHIHALAFLASEPSEADLERLHERMYAPWAARLVAHGMKAPTREHGLDVKPLDLSDPGAAVASYITARSTPEGMASELTDAMGGKRAKGGNRTPWDLLSDAMGGDLRARALWHEWERASKGKRGLTWGPMKRLLEIPDLSDQELADSDDLEAALIAALSREQWAALLERPHGPADLLAVAERAYSSGDRDHEEALEAAMFDVCMTLKDWGVMEAAPPPVVPEPWEEARAEDYADLVF